MEIKFNKIQDLKIEKNWRVVNGEDSFVIPYPTTHPFNLVFHGHSRFEYGHYGIHLGQEDRLTFLGHPGQVIKCYFIDCRSNSPTKGNRAVYDMNAGSEFRLCIPPGVAHAFEGLENIHTINEYKLYLPEPDKWLSGETHWNLENDVINLPLDIADSDLPYFEANNCEASEIFYEWIRQHQKENIPHIETEYPFTEDLLFDDGTNARIMLKKKLNHNLNIKEWEPVPGIEGLGWQKHLIYWSGEYSGFIPFTDDVPFYIVDHGYKSYSHDAFGIHLSQQDRLTFVGDPDQLISLVLVDCRENAPTMHNEIKIEFYPAPFRFLVIPNGVAHRFENLHKVFTINRPFIYSDNLDEYQPGNDVIDWPIDNKNFPCFKVSSAPATKEYYANLALNQKQLMSKPATHSTPVVISATDNDGVLTKIAFRKKEKLM